jgi:hypothetical protein
MARDRRMMERLYGDVREEAMRFLLPYHTTKLAVEIDDNNFVGSLGSKVEDYRPGKAPQELVEASLDTGAADLVRGRCVRTKKAKVVQAIHPLTPAQALTDAVRGQYGTGTVLGKAVRAYRQDPDVAPNSNTETYVACKLKLTTGAGPACRSVSARAYGVPSEAIATIVDQPNDVLMFKRSGLSIAMGNASDEVIRRRPPPSPIPTDEGFSKATERFIPGAKE